MQKNDEPAKVITKAEMLAFFKKYHGNEQRVVDEDNKRIAAESKAAIDSSILTRAERPAPHQPPQQQMQVRPPSAPNASPEGPSIRSRLLQTTAKNRNDLPPSMPELGPMPHNKVTLILDVDETLVHSSFRGAQKNADLEINIEVNGQPGVVYVRKRPYLKEFLEFCATRFEVVIFTASLRLYCDPLMDLLDEDGKLGRKRLFREHCTRQNNAYIKDLSLLGRPLERIAIIDNSPVAYYFQPRNAIPILSWFEDPKDEELLKLLPMLGQLATCSNVYDVLDPLNAKLLQQQQQQNGNGH